MNTSLRRVGLVALAGCAVGLSACTATAEPDNMILQYTGGSMEGSKFKDCVDPGTVGDGSVNDTDIFLMTSERTWNIAKEGGDSNTAIEVATKPVSEAQPGAKVKVWLKADFFLNTSCRNSDGKISADSPVVKWWETIGRRYGADVDGNEPSDVQSKDKGWQETIKNSLVPSEVRAIQDSARLYTADVLDSGANGSWAAMEEEIEKRLSTDLNTNGSFYCGPGYNRSDPKNCPPIRVTVTDIDYADSNVAARRASVTAAELEAQEKVVRAQAQVAEAKILATVARDPNYMRIKELENALAIANTQLEAAKVCSANPNCTVVIGTDANVNVGK